MRVRFLSGAIPSARDGQVSSRVGVNAVREFRAVSEASKASVELCKPFIPSGLRHTSRFATRLDRIGPAFLSTQMTPVDH